jgi:hypothetical protein
MQPYYGSFMMPNMFCGMPMMMPLQHHCRPSTFGQGFGMGIGMSLGMGLGKMFNCWF